MGIWNEIRTAEDIAHLMEAYDGFHDACLVGLQYQSGAWVDSESCMHFRAPEELELRVVFHSQWSEEALELRFTGVRKFSVAGWQERYSCDIFDCYLAIHTDLVAGRDEPLIVWADNEHFSPKDLVEKKILAEPADSYIVAAHLQWRLMEKQTEGEEGGEKVCVKGTPQPL